MRRVKAPIKVSFVGYEESAWKAIADLKVLADEHKTLKDTQLKVRSCDCDENVPQDLDEEEPMQPQVSGVSHTSTRSSRTWTTSSESLDDEMLRRYERGGLTLFSEEDGKSYSTPEIVDNKTPAAILAEKSTMDLHRKSLDRIKNSSCADSL
jgi:hypothetical protein